MNRDEAKSLDIQPDLYGEIVSSACEPALDSTDVFPDGNWWPYVCLMWHYTVVAFRVARGRWYVWRDRPTWVVRWFSQDFQAADAHGREAVRQAKDDLETRRMKKTAA